MFIRAYTYIRELGGPGLTAATEMAVLNANYVRAKLADVYSLAYDKPSMHEVVFTDKKLKRETGVQTLDVAKRLMDFGYHPPTIYFPLPAVTGGAGALMIEPTETETPETLDAFCDAMRAIADEAKQRSRDRQERAARHGAAPPRRDAGRAQAQAPLDPRVAPVTLRPLAEAGGGDVPRRRGVLQARLAAGLHDYPRGKSAMVYYDGGDDLAAALERLGAVVPPGADVLVRFAECADPARELARKLDEFARRFGSPPAWNAGLGAATRRSWPWARASTTATRSWPPRLTPRPAAAR